MDLTLAPSFPFITGNSFKYVCRHVLDEAGHTVNPNGYEDHWFVKIDFVDAFWRNPPKLPFYLFTHNGDFSVEQRFRPFLDHPSLIHWYAQNPLIDHHKLTAIPIGIANQQWKWGSVAELKSAMATKVEKNKLAYASYSFATNSGERTVCAHETKLPPEPTVGFEQHLLRMKRSYFVIAPRGYGADCHRTWEALYVGAVPITTAVSLKKHFGHLPIIFINDWSEYRNLDLSEELYNKVRRDVSEELRFDVFFASLLKGY